MGATGWPFRSITIDRPAILGGVPFGRNTALPDMDTTTASSGRAGAESVTSQTATRSFSIVGFNAVCEPAWNNIAQNNRIQTIAAPFQIKQESSVRSLNSGIRFAL